MTGGLVCYVHRRKDTDEPVYVGVGTLRRAGVVAQRPPQWRDAAPNGITVDIVARGVSKAEAAKWERAAIAFLGRRDLGTGPLVNRNDGGPGSPPGEPRRRVLDKRVAHDDIRARVAAGQTQGEIAAALGVSRQHIGRVMRDLGLDARPRGRPRKMRVVPVAPLG